MNEIVSYDHNGNIKTLQRTQRKHQLTDLVANYISEQVDNLTYTYNSTIGDQLLKVEDAVAGATGKVGFDNGTTGTSNDFTYDVNGNLLTDANKTITSNITYNVLGKPTLVTYADGRKLEYVYDASGSKLAMKTYATGGALQTTTDYVGGFVYENNVLSFFGSPEGRVVKNGAALEFQYAIADHQGNTRVVFTSATPAPVAPNASFEGDANDGAAQYLNIVGGNVVPSGSANHTVGGSKVVRMNRSYKIGPAKSVKVYPGDKIDIEVWEYHEGTNGFGTTGSPLNALITSVASAFGGVSGAAGESGLIYSGVNSTLNTYGTGGNQGDWRPAAYLNFILFDKNYNVLDAGWQVAPSTTFTKQKLSFATKEIKEEGYLYAWLSYENDSDNWVYFDDFKVTHTKTNIVQYNEYYPFGLQASTSWTRDNSTNNYLYNAGNELNKSSGWYEMFYRGYDPATGRMLQVDPYATAYASTSSYNYSLNNPVILNDPTGGYASLSNSYARMDSRIVSLQSDGWAVDFQGDTGGGGGIMYSLNTDVFGYQHEDLYGRRNPGFVQEMLSASSLRSLSPEQKVEFIRLTGTRLELWERWFVTTTKHGVVDREFRGYFWKEEANPGQIQRQGPKLNAEASINELLLMKVGEKITGDQLAKIFESNSIETPISISKVIKNLTRVDAGFQVNLTLLARGALAIIPKSPDVKNGAIISITQEAWPDGKNTVLHLTSPDINIYYDDKLVPLNIYINNNGFTMDKVAYPSYYQIFKGEW
jgi:RHS repeat-associated protein